MEHSNEYYQLQNELLETAQENAVINLVTKFGLTPKREGNQWCFLLGDGKAGVAGFGNSVFDAAADFNTAFYKDESKVAKPCIHCQGGICKQLCVN